MWILIHALGIFYLLESVNCQQPSPTKNPECPGMHKAAQHVENAIKLLLKKSTTCTVNKHCSGINCKWANGGILEVELEHCEKPIKYHLHFKSTDHGVDVDRQLGKGQSITLYSTEYHHLTKVTFKIRVTELKRTGNNVTTKIDLLTCFVGGRCVASPLLQEQNFCVSMRNCPAYNASSSEYAPCVATTLSPSNVPSASGHGPFSGWFTGTHGAGTPGTADPANHHQPNDSEENKGRLSLAAIIGISVAGVFTVVIVAGVLVYWKKNHHRSRLRAAYYNDISMHDPLYEDFGPEVA